MPSTPHARLLARDRQRRRRLRIAYGSDEILMTLVIDRSAADLLTETAAALWPHPYDYGRKRRAVETAARALALLVRNRPLIGELTRAGRWQTEGEDGRTIMYW
jgi:hypothetical protein